MAVKVAKYAEISTPVTYEFTVPGVADPIYTVTAYAYPDDRSCTVGSFVDHVAGND